MRSRENEARARSWAAPAERRQGRRVGGPGCEHAGGRAASRGGTSSPVEPGTTRSGMPPTRVASTGRPAAIASRIEYGRPSQSVISPNASQSRELLRDVAAMAEQPHAIGRGRALRDDARSRRGRGPRRTRAAPRARSPAGTSASSSVIRSFGGASRAVQPSTRRAAGWAARRQRARRIDSVVDQCRPSRGEMPRSRASCRSWLETHTIASVRGATACSLAVYRAPAAPSAPRERPAVRGEDGARPEACEREPGQHAGLGRVDLHDVRRDRARQRAQLAHGGDVVVRMRIANEVANVVKGHAEARAGVGQRSRPARGDLDLVALAQSRHERGRERLRAARLGERHDHEQPGGQRDCWSMSIASHCGRERH